MCPPFTPTAMRRGGQRTHARISYVRSGYVGGICSGRRVGRFHMSFTSVCTYFGRIDVYVASRDQNGPAQGWRRSRLDMDLTVWTPWGSGGGVLRALQDRWKTWRFRGPGGAETANLLGVGRRF